jgi:hypothetical protein
MGDSDRARRGPNLTMAPGGCGLTRRELLQLPAALALASLAARSRGQEAQPPGALPALPRVNGGLNLQPIRRAGPLMGQAPTVGPDLVELQTQILYELGFSSMRITLTFESFNQNFLAAVPYVRAARALGIDVVGVMADFRGFDLIRALVEPRARRRVVEAYLGVYAAPVEAASAAISRVGSFSLQVLNEPTHFFGIDPSVYVRDFLAPVYEDVKLLAPELPVVGAASVGNVDGVLRTREMIQTGLESVCDLVAYHIYSEITLPMLEDLSQLPVLVTESGAAGQEKHRPWVEQVFPRIRSGIQGVREVFYFDLFDAEPNRWRAIDVHVDEAGVAHPVAESPELVQLWIDRVQAASELPHAPFSELVPDFTAYAPTDLDSALVTDAQLEMQS